MTYQSRRNRGIIARDSRTGVVVNTSRNLRSLIGSRLSGSQSRNISSGNYTRGSGGGISTTVNGSTTKIYTDPLSVGGQISNETATRIRDNNKVISREAEMLQAVIRAKGKASKKDIQLANTLAKIKLQNSEQIRKYNKKEVENYKQKLQKYQEELKEKLGGKITVADMFGVPRTQPTPEPTPKVEIIKLSDGTYTTKTLHPNTKIKWWEDETKKEIKPTTYTPDFSKINTDPNSTNTQTTTNTSLQVNNIPQREWNDPWKEEQKDTYKPNYNLQNQEAIKLDIPKHQQTINVAQEQQVENRFGIKKEEVNNIEWKGLTKLAKDIMPNKEEITELLDNKPVMEKLKENEYYVDPYKDMTYKESMKEIGKQLDITKLKNWVDPSKFMGAGTLAQMGAYTIGMGVLDRVTSKMGYGVGDVLDTAIAVPDLARPLFNPTPINWAIATYEAGDLAENFIPFSDLHYNIRSIAYSGKGFRLPHKIKMSKKDLLSFRVTQGKEQLKVHKKGLLNNKEIQGFAEKHLGNKPLIVTFNDHNGQVKNIAFFDMKTGNYVKYREGIGAYTVETKTGNEIENKLVAHDKRIWTKKRKFNQLKNKEQLQIKKTGQKTLAMQNSLNEFKNSTRLGQQKIITDMFNIRYPINKKWQGYADYDVNTKITKTTTATKKQKKEYNTWLTALMENGQINYSTYTKYKDTLEFPVKLKVKKSKQKTKRMKFDQEHYQDTTNFENKPHVKSGELKNVIVRQPKIEEKIRFNKETKTKAKFVERKTKEDKKLKKQINEKQKLEQELVQLNKQIGIMSENLKNNEFLRYSRTKDGKGRIIVTPREKVLHKMAEIVGKRNKIASKLRPIKPKTKIKSKIETPYKKPELTLQEQKMFVKQYKKALDKHEKKLKKIMKQLEKNTNYENEELISKLKLKGNLDINTKNEYNMDEIPLVQLPKINNKMEMAMQQRSRQNLHAKTQTKSKYKQQYENQLKLESLTNLKLKEKLKQVIETKQNYDYKHKYHPNINMLQEQNINVKLPIHMQLARNVHLGTKLPKGNTIKAYIPRISTDKETILINKKFKSKKEAEKLGMLIADNGKGYIVDTKKINIEQNEKYTNPIKLNENKVKKFQRQGKKIVEKYKYRNDNKGEWMTWYNKKSY